MASMTPYRGQRGGAAGTHPLAQLRDELNTIFEQFFGGGMSLMGADREALRLWDFDVSENNNEIQIRAEMPGFEPNDINIQMDNDVLTIQAESRSEGQQGRQQGEQQGQQQRSYRSYRRSIQLPAGVDAERASASYRNGVLELRIPRTAASRARRITVQGQAGGGQPQQQGGAQAGQGADQAGGQAARRQK